MAQGQSSIPAWRRLRRRFYWGLARLVLALGRVLPLASGRWSGALLAILGLLARPRERRLARANIALAFPDWAPAARRRLLWRSALALGSNLWDFVAAERLLAGPGLVQAASGGEQAPCSLPRTVARLRESGRGVLLLAGHLGCWELCGAWLRREIGELAVVTGTIHNPPVDRMVQERRRGWGLTVLPRDRGPAPLLRVLRSGGVVAVLLDQNLGAGSEPVPFFGHPAPTATAFAKIALKYDIPVLPVGIARRGRGHVITHLPPLEPAHWVRGAEAAGPAALQGFLGACNLRLEELVRRNPAEWVWFHDRWDLRGGRNSPR